MRELIRTNDPVLISFLQALLSDSNIDVLVLDQNMSIVEGSLGILPRRLLVPEHEHARAVRLARDGGIDIGD